MIRGYALNPPETNLSVFYYPSPSLGSYEIEILIRYCGLCRSDLNIINNSRKASKYPLILGHEIVGNVARKGSLVKQFSVGDWVGVGWQSGACFECESCIRGDETLCSSKKRTCVDQQGGFAESIFVDARFAYLIPSGIDPSKAAPLLCAGATSFIPFKQHRIQASMQVAIVGIGGLGHLAIQFAHAFGCEVTAISSTPSKEEDARKLGAHHFFSLINLDSIIQSKQLFDFVLSTTSAPIDWEKICRCLKPRGKFCLLGIPKQNISLPAQLLISNNISLFGSGTGNRISMMEMLKFSEQHKIDPLIDFFPMEKVNEAIAHLTSNKARYRVVLYN